MMPRFAYRAHGGAQSRNDQVAWGRALRAGYGPAIEFTERAVRELGRVTAAEVLHCGYQTLCAWIQQGLVRDTEPPSLKAVRHQIHCMRYSAEGRAYLADLAERLSKVNTEGGAEGCSVVFCDGKMSTPRENLEQNQALAQGGIRAPPTPG